MSAELLPLDAVKALLGLDPAPDPVADPKLTAALPVITEYFENYCKRGLAYVAAVVEEMPSERRIALFRYPIEALTEVLIDEVAPPTLPYVDKANGVVRFGSWWYCAQPVRITYAGGYPDDAVPADLADAYARACADYAGVTYTAGASTGGGAPLKSLGLGSGALTVAFDTGAASQSSYDTSEVPPLLAPYHFVLEHYRRKDVC